LSKELISAADLKVFVDVSYDERLRRRVVRDLTRTTETEEYIRDYFQNVVAPAHDELVQPTMESADIIVSNEDKIQ
jgi:uridine kinase